MKFNVMKMTVAQRLYLLLILGSISVVSLAWLSYYQLGKVYESANYANSHSVPSYQALDDAHGAFSNMRALGLIHILETDAGKKKALEEKLEGQLAKVNEALDWYEMNNVVNDQDKSLLDADRAA